VLGATVHLLAACAGIPRSAVRGWLIDRARG
jgi:hypothetical protein